MKIIVLACFFIFTIHFCLVGQKADHGSKTTIYPIASKEGKQYKLKVTLPNSYDLNKTYKVLYYLDAWWLSELVLGSYAILSLSEKIEDVVLVGISLNADLLDWNKQRTFDFTPSAYNMPVQQTAGKGENAIKLDSTSTGGADKFLAFLEAEVLPYISAEFSNLDDRRGFIGHSFGGLFGVYSMQQKPKLFTDYIIISPSVWWNKPELLHAELFNSFTKQNRAAKIYLCYGKEESNLIIKSNDRMNEIISELDYDLLEYKFVTYDHTNHNSILSRAIYDGLFFVYKK